jgi:hypothetical protein
MAEPGVLDFSGPSFRSYITDLGVMRTELILPVYSWSALYATKFFGAFSSLESFGCSALSAYSPGPTIGPSSQAFPSGAHPYSTVTAQR